MLHRRHLAFLLSALLSAGAEPSAKPNINETAEDARLVLAAVVQAADLNRRLGSPRTDDALTEYYVAVAATAASKLPPERAVRAYLIGQSIALDTAEIFRKNPVTGLLWRRIEPDAARAVRLKVIGTPTLHRRHDLCQHFVDSAALVALVGEGPAEAAGLLKEMLDAQPGGSGFSFDDIAADFSGIAFAKRLLAEPAQLAGLSKSFTVVDVCVPPDGLPSGMPRAEFERRFGSLSDPRSVAQLTEIRKRIGELKANRVKNDAAKP